MSDHLSDAQNPSGVHNSGGRQAGGHLSDSDHLAVLGYGDSFERSMSPWANFALGFTYLSPLVGVYSLLAVALSTGGPPSVVTNSATRSASCRKKSA